MTVQQGVALTATLTTTAQNTEIQEGVDLAPANVEAANDEINSQPGLSSLIHMTCPGHATALDSP